MPDQCTPSGGAYLSAFSAWSGPLHPKALIVGEAWGESESIAKAPFVGTSGRELWRLLGEAFGVGLREHAEVAAHAGWDWVSRRETWLRLSGIALTNVFNLRPPDNKIEALCVAKRDLPRGYIHRPVALGKYIHPQWLPHVERLHDEIERAKPNLVIALGNTACWALLGVINIGTIRGAIAQTPNGQKVLPSYHPAAVLRQWAWRPILLADLMKAKQECEFPQVRRPERQVLVNPTLDELRWGAERIERTASASCPIACDIETAGGGITCVGFASSPDFALVVPFAAPHRPGGSYWATPAAEIEAWGVVRRLLCVGRSSILGQNFVYDLQYLTRAGIAPRNCTEDLMLLHHAAFPELQKGLGFLGSIYTNEPAWKLMRRKRPDTEKRDE